MSKTTRPPNASLGPSGVARRAQRLATTPDRYKATLTAAWSGKCAPRRAIKAQCLECVGFDQKAIADCTCWACPLYEYRPYQNQKTDLTPPPLTTKNPP